MVVEIKTLKNLFIEFLRRAGLRVYESSIINNNKLRVGSTLVRLCNVYTVLLADVEQVKNLKKKKRRKK